MNIKPLRTTITIKYRSDDLQLKSSNKAGFNYLLDKLERNEDVAINHGEDTGYLVMVTPLNGLTKDDVVYHLLNNIKDNKLNLKFKGTPKDNLLKLRLLYKGACVPYVGMWLLSILIVASSVNESIFIITSLLGLILIAAGLIAALWLFLENLST